MDSMNEQALARAHEHIDDACRLLNKCFAERSEKFGPEHILMCAQLIATEYNTIMIEKTSEIAVENLKSYLSHDF